MPHKHAVTSVPVISAIKERWSPRAFDADATVPESAFTAALEAARWAPSANNSQPARFVIGQRGSAEFATILEHLAPMNASWAKHASSLVANIAAETDTEGNDRPWAAYDLGQAVAYFTLQMQSEGYHLHQVGGFNAQAMHDALNLPQGHRIVSCTVIGKQGDPHEADLKDYQLEQELGERHRHHLDQLTTLG